VFEEAPTNVIVSTLLKSSVPWGVARGIVSTIWGGFFKLWETRRTGQVLRTWNSLSYKVGGTLEEKVNCYAVGIVGQTGFNGSSVTEGRSLRACR
jgi:hypothetical protein